MVWWIAIDKDTHSTYADAIATIQSAKPDHVFYASTSVPCFEYWLLLHYKYMTRPYVGTGARSPAEQVINEVKEYIPNYEKGRRDIFVQVVPHTDFAIKNAVRSLKQATQNATDNPSTKLHLLVRYLRDLKWQK